MKSKTFAFLFVSCLLGAGSVAVPSAAGAVDSGTQNPIASAAKIALELLRSGSVRVPLPVPSIPALPTQPESAPAVIAAGDRTLGSAVPPRVAANEIPNSRVSQNEAVVTDAIDALAGEIATVVAVDKQSLLVAWSTTDQRRLQVIFTALAQVGTPYRFGGNAPGGFDCSGLTSFAWASVGIRIPRVSSDQIDQASYRDLGQLRAGDLLWRPGHIGMSLGVPGIMVNATQTGRPVEVKRWGRLLKTGSPIND